MAMRFFTVCGVTHLTGDWICTLFLPAFLTFAFGATFLARLPEVEVCWFNYNNLAITRPRADIRFYRGLFVLCIGTVKNTGCGKSGAFCFWCSGV